ncbi:MAG: HAMP domain-containing histidine kinase [Candidatus Kapabacteria bacterium]|nr:HAMP domain-containing histidine kinase [Ignavibacteriota bacterium]MCW5883502.1 HAMP domain-containing histidine kinase [Candidatus Kapabacteria bacterium]
MNNQTVNIKNYIEELNKCSSVNSINNVIFEVLKDEFAIIESVIIEVDSNSNIITSNLNEESALSERIKYLIEEGIIDWALQTGEAQIIMDLQSQLKGISRNIIMAPFVYINDVIAIFIAFTEKNKDDIDNILNKIVHEVISITALKIKLIQQSFKVKKINSRLNELNERLINSLPMTTFGEISLTVLKEATLPLQIINSNVELIESGVGNTARRLEIIKQQTKSISEIINLLTEISLDSSKSEPEIFSLSELFDEISSVTASQIKTAGMKLYIEVENEKLSIKAIKTQLEYSLIHIILFFLTTEIESDTIYLTANIHNPRTIVISVKSDDSIFDANNFEKFVESIKQISKFDRMVNGFYSAKNIIKNSGGKIECLSKSGEGTIFRIYFPSVKNIKVD